MSKHATVYVVDWGADFEYPPTVHASKEAAIEDHAGRPGWEHWQIRTHGQYMDVDDVPVGAEWTNGAEG